MVKTELRDVMIVAMNLGLPMVESMSLKEFKKRLKEIKMRRLK